jgi:mono/diheme cytochrome c family protein
VLSLDFSANDDRSFAARSPLGFTENERKVRMMSTGLRHTLVGTSLALFAVLGACTVTPRGALDPNLAKAKDKAAQGATVFEAKCANCHGMRGEGVTAPAIMGSDGLPLNPADPSQSTLAANTDANEQQLRQQLNPGGMPSRPQFKTAQDVYEFIRAKMPSKQAGTLSSDEYWSVLNYMLVAHGTQVPEKGIDSDNARQVIINP